MSEQARLQFIVARDGLAAARKWAKRTAKIYRSAVLTSRKRGFDKPHHASLPEYRRGFIESYLEFKRFAA